MRISLKVSARFAATTATFRADTFPLQRLCPWRRACRTYKGDAASAKDARRLRVEEKRGGALRARRPRGLEEKRQESTGNGRIIRCRFLRRISAGRAARG